MKASELFIGAHVFCLGKERVIKSIVKKDTGVEVSFEGKNPVIVGADMIEPIVLTADVLEKNGIKRYATYTHPYFDYEPTEEELEREKRNYPFSCYESDDLKIQVSFYPSFTNINVSNGNLSYRAKGVRAYVHQLQMALSLCYIEKEIRL